MGCASTRSLRSQGETMTISSETLPLVVRRALSSGEALILAALAAHALHVQVIGMTWAENVPRGLA